MTMARFGGENWFLNKTQIYALMYAEDNNLPFLFL